MVLRDSAVEQRRHRFAKGGLLFVQMPNVRALWTFREDVVVGEDYRVDVRSNEKLALSGVGRGFQTRPPTFPQ